MDWGPKPFKSLNIWFLDPSFKNTVKQSWESYFGIGNPMTTLNEKLKKLKHDLKAWNKEVFGIIGQKIQSLSSEIGKLDQKDDESNLDEGDRSRRMHLLSELKLLLQKESSLLNQKAKVKWLEQGDINSKYFHSKIRWQRSMNELKGVDMDGVWCEDPTKVREEVRKTFEKRFSEPKSLSINLHNFEFPNLSENDNRHLTKDISDNEIEEAINECEGNIKAQARMVSISHS